MSLKNLLSVYEHKIYKIQVCIERNSFKFLWFSFFILNKSKRVFINRKSNNEETMC